MRGAGSVSTAGAPARNDEAAIQASIVAWARLIAPDVLIFAVPNGGYRTPREAALMKWTGVLAGVPDLGIIADGRAFFLEVKTAKGRLSDAQQEIIPKLEAIGAPVALVRSIDDARDAFAKWGIQTRESAPMKTLLSNLRN
jgi:VRR-NUC domain